MLVVFGDAFFGCLQIHGPATFPIMSFAWEAVENMLGVPVFEALNLVALEFNGFEDFRGSASVIDFAELHC